MAESRKSRIHIYQHPTTRHHRRNRQFIVVMSSSSLQSPQTRSKARDTGTKEGISGSSPAAPGPNSARLCLACLLAVCCEAGVVTSASSSGSLATASGRLIYPLSASRVLRRNGVADGAVVLTVDPCLVSCHCIHKLSSKENKAVLGRVTGLPIFSFVSDSLFLFYASPIHHFSRRCEGCVALRR